MLQSRWSSSKTRFIVDRPPSQPRNRQQMIERPSSSSVTESCHKDPDTGIPRRGITRERLQLINSKWTSSSAVTTDRPPLQPLNRRESTVRGLQQSGSRWISGSQAAFDTASSKTLVHHRTILQPSSVSTLKQADAMENHDVFETTIRTLCILNLSRVHLFLTASGTGTGLCCSTSPRAPEDSYSCSAYAIEPTFVSFIK
jgi:hypothetical protein